MSYVKLKESVFKGIGITEMFYAFEDEKYPITIYDHLEVVKYVNKLMLVRTLYGHELWIDAEYITKIKREEVQ
ncbi:hypothetical protein [Oceanobacillus sp. FSL H7-0719]|uniref:hypothetical protein n=1 Tax=Oceanobacillus sp. FSL H7-0719 TaxID=2954507 RepID=UPI00324E6FE7